MKKIISVSAIVFFLFASISCSKNTEDKRNDGIYHAKLNGVLTDFSFGAGISIMGDNGKISVFDLGGATGPSTGTRLEDGTPVLEIDFWTTDGDIKPGTYTAAGTNGSLRCQYIVQTKDETVIHVSDGDFTFKIDEISRETGIRGSFYGTLRLNGDIIKITDGEVDAPYN